MACATRIINCLLYVDDVSACFLLAQIEQIGPNIGPNIGLNGSISLLLSSFPSSFIFVTL